MKFYGYTKKDPSQIPDTQMYCKYCHSRQPENDLFIETINGARHCYHLKCVQGPRIKFSDLNAQTLAAAARHLATALNQAAQMLSPVESQTEPAPVSEKGGPETIEPGSKVIDRVLNGEPEPELFQDDEQPTEQAPDIEVERVSYGIASEPEAEINEIENQVLSGPIFTDSDKSAYERLTTWLDGEKLSYDTPAGLVSFVLDYEKSNGVEKTLIGASLQAAIDSGGRVNVKADRLAVDYFISTESQKMSSEIMQAEIDGAPAELKGEKTPEIKKGMPL